MTVESDRFKSQLEKFIVGTGKTSERLEELVKLKFTKEFVEKTPVKTGQAKAGWKFVSTSRSVQDVKSVRRLLFKFRAIVLQNSVFYTPTMFTFPDTNVSQWGLEGGRSAQAPNGIIGPGVEQVLNDWDALVKQARAGE